MNRLIISLFFIIFFSPKEACSQRNCYEVIVNKGLDSLNLKTPNYKAAFEHFIAARNCWDIKKDLHNIDGLINQTTNRWTADLKTARDSAKALAVKEKDLKERVEEKKKQADRNALINISYILVYKSQKALAENKISDALGYAYWARDTIEVYNKRDSIDREIKFSPFIDGTFGNAVFASFHRKDTLYQPQIDDICYSKNKDRFCTSEFNRGLKIWEIREDSIHILKSINVKSKEFINSISFSDNGENLLVCIKDGDSFIWREGNQNDIKDIKSDTTLIHGEFINKNQFLTVDRLGNCQIRNINNDSVYSKSISKNPFLEVKLDKDKRFAYLRTAHQIYKWDLNSLDKQIDSLPEALPYLYGFEISQDGVYLLTHSKGESKIWLNNPIRIYGEIRFDGVVNSLSLDHQNQKIFIGTNKNLAKLFDYSNQKVEEVKVDTHQMPISEVLFSKNAEYRISTSMDSTFYISSRKSLSSYLGQHAGIITSVVFSRLPIVIQTNEISDMTNREDKLLNILISSSDGLVRLWSTEGNILMNMPLGNVTPIYSGFLEEEKKIISITKEGVVTVSPTYNLIYEKIKTGKIKRIRPQLTLDETNQ